MTTFDGVMDRNTTMRTIEKKTIPNTVSRSVSTELIIHHDLQLHGDTTVPTSNLETVGLGSDSDRNLVDRNMARWLVHLELGFLLVSLASLYGGLLQSVWMASCRFWKSCMAESDEEAFIFDDSSFGYQPPFLERRALVVTNSFSFDRVPPASLHLCFSPSNPALLGIFGTGEMLSIELGATVSRKVIKEGEIYGMRSLQDVNMAQADKGAMSCTVTSMMLCVVVLGFAPYRIRYTAVSSNPSTAYGIWVYFETSRITLLSKIFDDCWKGKLPQEIDRDSFL
ncbi:hypothetical protein ARMGADRAFT_1029322 [Armillaria gallica]|uniref:Uncharacterized protein n=1 Tax=Armillaria gallica TaxID=47427 RepID=A0A2H3DVY3_ARMGA|nr:hypothetical protein ARMGADRAFT_1029322 [Armillaria gallica]